ncbi:MAG: hypothetical protein RLZZ528_1310 [Pseudomonadota bacterium]|jgi:Ca2+-binding RTX toxin-like protein
MATFIAKKAFQLDDIDLNWFVRFFDDYNFVDGYNDEMPNGTIVEDLFLIAGKQGKRQEAVALGGTGFVEGSPGALTAGTVEEIAVFNSALKQLYSVAGVSLDAADLYAASQTLSNLDDIALFATMLAGDDTIALSNFDDQIDGGDGNDDITGKDGNDTVHGGAGNDTLDGGLGKDMVLYTGTQAVTVDLSVTTQQATGFWGDDFIIGFEGVTTGSGNDSVTGSAKGNTLISGDGSDTVSGGGGRDKLTGGGQADVLSGGVDGDRDTFIYLDLADSTASERDLINDFVSGTDLISLSALDANDTASGNQVFGWGGKTATANAVWYADTGANLVVFADTNGDAVADFEIEVAGIDKLTRADFLL